MIAEQTWPEASIAIAGIALVGSVIVVVVWQLMATWRARMAGSREVAYKEVAAKSSEAQQRNAVALEQILAELRNVRERTEELERILKDVG